MKKLILTLILIAIFPLTSSATILVEPFLGYTALQYEGTVKYNGYDSNIQKSSLKGPIFGGQLGYLMNNIGMGFNYTLGKLSNGGEDGQITNMGVSLLFKFENFRMNGTYILSSSLEVKNSNISSVLTFKGKGFQIGFGYLLTEYNTLLSLEYLRLNYTEDNSDSFENLDQDTSGLLVRVSFPFEFGSGYSY